MSIKLSQVFYPHIVKEYDSVETFIAENEYNTYYDAMRGELASFNIDITNPAQYGESLTEDRFEAVSTIVFENQADADNYIQNCNPDLATGKMPIFIEDTTDHVV